MVIDVCGTTTGKSKQVYTRESTTCVWSSGKVVAAIMMAIMRDKGHLNYNEKVATYWPEFAKHGKGEITVADVMRMEAGLEKFDV